MRKKILILFVMLSAGLLISAYLSVIVNMSIKNEALELDKIRINDCIGIMAADKTTQLFFLCFFALTVLCVLVLLLKNTIHG